MNNENNISGTSWEKRVLESLAKDVLKEQRASRRWGILFKFLTFAYLTIFILMLVPDDLSSAADKGPEHTAVLKIEGVVSSADQASADNVIRGLQAAFQNDNTKGLILSIDSPGGSPVQAAMIYDEILRLKKANPDIKVYAVASDFCTSAAYYIASAADEIYASKASIVGSIGVLMNSFGFVNTLEKVGVERRLMTAGELKGVMDPFSPIKAEEQAIVQSMLDNVHKQFIDDVRQGRGERLKEDSQTFSGRFWTGEQAVSNGLIDGLSTTAAVARDIIGVEKLVDFTPEEDVFTRLSEQIGASAGQAIGAKFNWSFQ